MNSSIGRDWQVEQLNLCELIFTQICTNFECYIATKGDNRIQQCSFLRYPCKALVQTPMWNVTSWRQIDKLILTSWRQIDKLILTCWRQIDKLILTSSRQIDKLTLTGTRDTMASTERLSLDAYLVFFPVVLTDVCVLQGSSAKAYYF